MAAGQALAEVAPAAPAPGASPGARELEAPTGDEDENDPAVLRARVAALRAQVRAEPGNLGAQLDLAIAYCLSGQAEDGLRLFLLLDSLPDLPPAIAEVIAWYRSGGCTPQARLRPSGFVGAGGGWARNFNLAPLSERVYLPALDAQLVLDEASQRRDGPFSALEAGGSWPLSADGRWTLGAYVQAVRYRQASEHAFTGGQASIAWREQGRGQATEVQAAAGALSVGTATRIHTGTLQASRMWGAGSGWWWGGAALATRIGYAGQRALDAQQYELRARARWQQPGGRLTADVGWLSDEQVNERPGGNRRGPLVQGHAAWMLPGGRLLDATWRRSWMRDSAAYSPALFGEQQRTPRVTTWSVALRQPLERQLNARLEYRSTRSQDSMELFRYTSQSTWVSLEWSWSGAGP